jgi:hypothetical protein
VTLDHNREVALRAVDVGLYVVACHPATKKALVQEWQNRATNLRNGVTYFWNTRPGAVVGIVCRKSGIITIDCDRGHKEGEDGVETFGNVIETVGAGEFPDCPATRTPNGGVHLPLKSPIAEIQRGAWCVHSRHRPGCADAPDDAGARRQRDARCPIPTGWKIPARHTCCRVPRPSFSHALCAASKKFCISGSARALEVSARPERYDDSRPTPPMRIVPLVGSPLGASARGAAHIAHRRAPLAPGGASAFGALRSCTVGRSVANDPDRKWLISSGLRPIGGGDRAVINHS